MGPLGGSPLPTHLWDCHCFLRFKCNGMETSRTSAHQQTSHCASDMQAEILIGLGRGPQIPLPEPKGLEARWGGFPTAQSHQKQGEWCQVSKPIDKSADKGPHPLSPASWKVIACKVLRTMPGSRRVLSKCSLPLLLFAKHYSQQLPCTISFNPHKAPSSGC